MNFYLGMYLALGVLGRFAFPAPVPETVTDLEVMRSPEFQDAADGALGLITKILGDLPAVYKSLIHITTLSLDESDSSKLQFLKESLNLTEPSPLQPLSNKFKLDVTLGHMVEGLKVHKTLLKVISELAHVKPEKLNNLLYELRDALLRIHKMQLLIKAVKEPEKVSEIQLKKDLAPKLEDEYVSQVATHLALIQFRQFTRDVSRSLQSMIISSPEHETQES